MREISTHRLADMSIDLDLIDRHLAPISVAEGGK